MRIDLRELGWLSGHRSLTHCGELLMAPLHQL